MQAVILAAGASSRFQPYSQIPHKSYFSIAGKKIIEHTLLELKKSGVEEAIVVIGDEKNKLGQEESLGIKIKYAFQREPLGAGEALLSIKELIHGDFYLIYPYHINFSKFSKGLTNAKKEKDDMVLLLKEEGNVSQYGVAKVQGDKVLEIVEKPQSDSGKLRIVGMYLIPEKFLDTLADVPVEHYSLEKAISIYARKGNVTFSKTSEDTFSLKYPWNLFVFSKALLGTQKKYISEKASIASSTVILGNVVIEEGAKILDRATIKGPCFIGKNVVIGDNALIREYCDIEADCVIGAYAEVKNSIIQEGTKMHSGFLGDSIVGRNARLAAYFSIANKRLDRSSIQVNGVDTGLTSLGGIIGDNVSFGVRASIMPGIIIGNNCVIGPGTAVTKNISDNTKYFVKATEVVEKAINE